MRWIFVDHGKHENRPSWQHRKVVAYGDSWEASLSYNALKRHRGFGLGVRLRINGMESDVGLDLFAGRLLSVWMRLRSPFTKWLRLDMDKHSYHSRSFGVRLFPGYKWLSIECFAPDETWSRDEPWWHRLEFGPGGRKRTEQETIDSSVTMVPMPEGNYNAKWATRETQ